MWNTECATCGLNETRQLLHFPRDSAYTCRPHSMNELQSEHSQLFSFFITVICFHKCVNFKISVYPDNFKFSYLNVLMKDVRKMYVSYNVLVVENAILTSWRQPEWKVKIMCRDVVQKVKITCCVNTRW